ncbi:MAG TPA: transporter substrate-binding domain-containing protein [Alphaproteobacteria bacterium]|nr:transporter substrate-binding domain-containing protein [Alphaproteobacteria bacterium]HRK98563.1 transporter substrate-binding domain-containing protein [Alphaproteobacteria bacterium]
MNKLLSLTLCLTLSFFSGQAKAESGISRIIETNTLRCGYVEYRPALEKDMATGGWIGFNADVMKVVADRLELTLDFTVPTGWATVVADLKAKKFDMLCSGFWVHPNVGKFALFSRPIMFQPVFVVVKEGDDRFKTQSALNDPSIKMVALDGDNPVNIAKVDFPQAQIMALPNMTDFSQVLVNVATGKADFTIVDAYTFGAYNKSNPGKLKVLDASHPVRIYPVSYVFGAEDVVFRDAVNAALDEMILDGTMNRIFDKYEEYPHAYYRAVVPYQNPY